MERIYDLSRTDTLSLSDLIIVYKNSQNDEMSASLTTVVDFIESQLDLDDKKNSLVTQFSSPNAEAFNVVVNDTIDANNNAWMIITPDASYTDMTITLPLYTSLNDKQEVLINCSQAITTLTIGLNGASAIKGAPTSLSANETFRLKYDKGFKTWHKVA